MTVELVTGHAGTGHIDSSDVGGLIAGVAGSGDYVLEEPYGTLDCTVQDNNHVTVGRGDLLINGRHVRVTAPETLTVASGTQGQQRHDLIAMHYDRDTSTGVETASLEVLRGTPGSSGTPGYGTDTILEGATARDMPLYRLDLDGISLSTSPARLFSTLEPVSAITSDVSKISQDVSQLTLAETPTVACVWSRDKFCSAARVIVDKDDKNAGLLVLSYTWTAGAGSFRTWAKLDMCRVSGWTISYGEWMGPCVWNRGLNGQLQTYANGGSDVIGVRLDKDSSFPAGTFFAGNIIAPVIRA